MVAINNLSFHIQQYPSGRGDVGITDASGLFIIGESDGTRILTDLYWMYKFSVIEKEIPELSNYSKHGYNTIIETPKTLKEVESRFINEETINYNQYIDGTTGFQQTVFSPINEDRATPAFLESKPFEHHV